MLTGPGNLVNFAVDVASKDNHVLITLRRRPVREFHVQVG